jgi:hypothetical protein
MCIAHSTPSLGRTGRPLQVSGYDALEMCVDDFRERFFKVTKSTPRTEFSTPRTDLGDAAFFVF